MRNLSKLYKFNVLYLYRKDSKEASSHIKNPNKKKLKKATNKPRKPKLADLKGYSTQNENMGFKKRSKLNPFPLEKKRKLLDEKDFLKKNDQMNQIN